MSDPNVPADLRYTKDHEWGRFDGERIVEVGITHYAQDALGDITYLELPEAGDDVAVGDGFGVVESVKTFSDLYAPVSGRVVETNEAALDDPSVLNEDPYGKGWLVRLEVEDASEFEGLMDAAAYAKHLEENG